MTGWSGGAGDASERIVEDFPLLRGEGCSLVYMDSAASAQKPECVVACTSDLMRNHYANVHRGIYGLSDRLTTRYERSREVMARFLGAGSSDEVVWQANATAAINLVARSYGGHVMERGKAVLISEMEHHANIVPWQLLEEERGCPLRVVRVTPRGDLDWDHYEELLDSGDVGLVSMTHISNVLGTVNPVEEIVRRAHDAGARVLIDGSQGAVHMPLQVKAWDCDFYVCTGHKLYGPTGVGVLYGKEECLSAMPPLFGGGDMIERVRFSGTTYAKPPARFEAGTPAIVEVIALACAVEWMEGWGWDVLSEVETRRSEELGSGLRGMEGVRIYGESEGKAGIWSFNLEGFHPSDVGMMLDDLMGVAVRTGHHCAQPLMEKMGVQGMVRASIASYNRGRDVEKLLEGLERIMKMKGKRK